MIVELNKPIYTVRELICFLQTFPSETKIKVMLDGCSSDIVAVDTPEQTKDEILYIGEK